MAEYVIFGGTTEGRELAQWMQAHQKSAAVCVATDYGHALLQEDSLLQVFTGRLSTAEMCRFLQAQAPHAVIDATHPYAEKASSTIKAACAQTGFCYVRVLRTPAPITGCRCFATIAKLIEHLNSSDSIIFSTLGAKEALALRQIQNFETRVWLRILPSEESIAQCLAAGFSRARLLCMQGPFSQELNTALLRHTGAEVLLTKESGTAGGFAEKCAAAQDIGAEICVLQRPPDAAGISLQALTKRLWEGTL